MIHQRLQNGGHYAAAKPGLPALRKDNVLVQIMSPHGEQARALFTRREAEAFIKLIQETLNRG